MVASLGSILGCRTPSPDSTATLRVGCDFDNEPFASIDANGQAVGRDVEMMEAIGARMGARVEFVRIPFNDLLAALDRNDIDVVCATMGITAERAKIIDFSEPYFATRISALVLADGPKNLDELAGKRVSASPNTTSEFALLERLKDSVPVLDNPDKKKADARVLNGDVAAAVIDGPDAIDFAKASEGRLAVLAEPVALERYAMSVRKGNSALLSRVDQALSAMRTDGTLAALDSKYGLRSDSPASR